MPQQIDVPGMGVVEFPDGMSDDQIAAAIRANMPNQYSVAPDSTAGKVVGALDKVEATPYIGPVVKGIRDVTKGGAQLIAHGINAVAPSILSDEDLRGVDNDVRVSEQRYQQARQARTPQSITSLVTGQREEPGIDWGRMGGSILATGPFAATKAVTIPKAVIKGAALGGSLGALNPTLSAEESFASQKVKQIGIGAAGGGLFSAIGGGLSRVIQPKTSPEVRALIKQGVTPTPGQVLGGGMARFEEKLTSVPVVGDAIIGAQRRAVEDFNRAAYGRALDPIGGKVGAEVGREGVRGVKAALTGAYDDLLPKLQFRADQTFAGEIGNLQTMIQNGNVPPTIAKQFESILRNDVFSRMTKQGAMDGRNFKDLETVLGQKIKSFSRSPDPNDQALGRALGEVMESARGVLARSNPQHADKLARINQGYANYARIRDAASRTGAEEGVFTPAQLQAAVRSADKSVGKGKFATGNALLQDLSESGKKVLGKNYPDSGTAGRLMAAANPLWYLSMGAGAIPYTPMGQKAIVGLLTKRPDIAEPISRGLLNASPMLGAATAGGLLGFYGPSAP